MKDCVKHPGARRTTGGKCSPCGSEQTKAWRDKSPENKAKANKRNAQTEVEQRAWFDEQKNKPCMDCEVCYPPWVMDFDHRPGEVKELTLSASFRLSRERLLIEMAKCDVVCSNCHRQRTHERNREV